MTKKALRALILEDREADARLLEIELARQGFEVQGRRAWSAATMREALEEGPWDVVLSDHHMPGFGASAALRLLQESGQDLPFLVISGALGEDAAVAAMRAGAHDYLMSGKLARLGVAIERELREAELRAAHREASTKVRHLNRVLRAIRRVNQLIVQEKDAARLVQRTCELLVETRGYPSVVLMQTDAAGRPVFVASAVGSGGPAGEAGQAIRTADLTECMKEALECTAAVVHERDTPACAPCPLRGAHCGRSRVAQSLMHGDRAFGVLSVALSEGAALDAEERGLLEEVVGDIAFALHGIEQEAAREQAEHELRASEARYRDLYDHAPNAYFSVRTSDGTIRGCNEAAGALLGVEPSALLGRTVFELCADSPLGKDKARRVMQGQVAGREVRGVELQRRRPDGAVLDVSLSAEASRGEGGEVVEARATVIDITERNQLRVQIAQSDRLASMGMLAAGVAHEINNPLAYLLYNLGSVAEELPVLSDAVRRCRAVMIERLGPEEWERVAGSSPGRLEPAQLDDVGQRLRDALEGAQRIREVARALSAFSRADEDRTGSVDLRQAIEVAINMAFHEIKYRASLVKDYGRISSVLANDGRLSQVFLNLLINASHAIEEGDVEGNQIRVRTWQEGDEVCAEVRDTGKGISPAHLPHLFEPFFTTKPAGSGTGLGLAISRSIVEEIGGRIEVRSEPGQGTSFVVRLPVRALPAPPPPPVAELEAPQPVRRGRILLVDDERAIRAAMARMLRAHDVVQAASGLEAKAALEADPRFDLILCDVMMPGLSGVELHEWLARERPELARCFVFMTGGAFTSRAKGYLAGAQNRQLAKPFDGAVLMDLVKEFVSASE